MKMQKGNSYVVHVHLDEDSYRIVASAKIEKYLSKEMPEYKSCDEVDIMIWQKTDLGFKVIVDNKFAGLIFKNEIFFYIGVVSFMAGHVFYIIYFSHFGFSYITLAAGLIVYGALFAQYCHRVMVKKPALAAGYMAYGLMLLIFACGMASVFSFDHVYSSLLALAGVTVFAYSDTRIAYNMIGHGSTSDFTIMLTYVLANVLLVLSLWCINV